MLVKAYKMQYSIYTYFPNIIFVQCLIIHFIVSESDTPSVPLILISHRLVLLCNQGLLCYTIYYAVKLVLLRWCNQNYVQFLVLDQNWFIWKNHFKVFYKQSIQ